MRLPLFALLTSLLLAGCASTRPAGDGSACDCQHAVRVPDKVFREFLLEKGLAEKAGWHKLKPTEKGCRTDTLECYSRGIRSLQGIEMFPQLEQLTCSDNPISELNLQALTNLRRLYALDTPLQRLDLSQCHQLTAIQLSHTLLDTLDLTPLPHLTALLCIYTPLRHLDLSPCPNLNTLYIRFTQIHSLDLTPCTSFWQLHALDTPLERVLVTPEQYQSDIKVSVEAGVRIIPKDNPLR